MIYVKTPGTTANMGPGFDCIGMALSIYNHLHVRECDIPLKVTVKREQAFPVPRDNTNLIYQTMVNFYKEIDKAMPNVELIQEDYIPMTRGLGSSAACIVSGLIAANTLSGAGLCKDELLQMSAKIEGHPDNVAPAILGGMVVGAISGDTTKFVHIPVPKEIKFHVMIPEFQLSTEKAREVLPKAYTIQDCIFNASRAGLLIASVMSENWDNLDFAMDDRIHQPYRKSLIPNMEEIFEHSRGLGAKGVFLSGAGPTLIAVTHENGSFVSNMTDFLSSLGDKWTIDTYEPDGVGATIEAL